MSSKGLLKTRPKWTFQVCRILPRKATCLLLNKTQMSEQLSQPKLTAALSRKSASCVHPKMRWSAGMKSRRQLLSRLSQPCSSLLHWEWSFITSLTSGTIWPVCLDFHNDWDPSTKNKFLQILWNKSSISQSILLVRSLVRLGLN